MGKVKERQTGFTTMFLLNFWLYGPWIRVDAGPGSGYRSGSGSVLIPTSGSGPGAGGNGHGSTALQIMHRQAGGVVGGGGGGGAVRIKHWKLCPLLQDSTTLQSKNPAKLGMF